MWIRSLIAIIIFSFITTLFATKFFIRYFKKIGLTVIDIHKKNKPLIARSGGIPVIAGIFIGAMSYTFAKIFFYNSSTNLLFLFAAILTLFLITLTGFLDDLLTITDKAAYKDEETGYRLKQWQKPLLTLPAVIPLMAIMAGNSIISLPIIGEMDVGILYPLLLVPIGIFGAANMVNLLEGLNGIASGMGIVFMGMLGLYAYINGEYTATILAFATFGALLAFYLFHKTPAKILAGDSLTYLIGAMLACIAIVGNMEKAVLICSIPFFIEFVLKARGKFKKETLGRVDEEGKIHSKYKKIYSLPHIWMRTGKYTEKQIVYFLIGIELIFSSLIWLI